MSRFEIDLRARQGAFELAVDLASDARALALFGPSGAGKTTLVETLCGLRRQALGRIVIDGEVWQGGSARLASRARRIGFVPQDAALFPHLDVRANVLASPRAREGETFRRTVEALGIESLLERRPATLSGGEARRVALARALCSDPALLVLDEPFVALDLPLRRRILADLVALLAERKLPLILVSHDPAEVLALCDEVALLEHGRTVRRGPPRELLTAARLGATDFENVLAGTVLERGPATARVAVGEDSPATFVIPLPREAVGERTLFSVRADEVLLAAERPRAISARNLLAARIVALDSAASGDVYARCALAPGAELSVSLTADAARELALAPDVSVWLLVKTQSCRPFAGAPRTPRPAS